ncbi:MAG: nitrous oxide reductase family maturation protein NosD [Elusimicrobia bacterium]|nr:nitrous oxide reductase family maturation protein NosD [Elusimicrobiota bacterium]
MTQDAPAAAQHPTQRLSAALGTAAGVILAASLFFPYWQARLFAPQYRNGLTATMYAYKVTGDVAEIDELNHYIGMRPLVTLAVLERLAAIPSVLALAAFCVFAFWRGSRLMREGAAIAAAFYVCAFIVDMKFWMTYAATHLDPMAPLKLKPFSLPIIGAGKVAQFHSEMLPMVGFYLAVAAASLLVAAYRLSVKNDAPRAVDSTRMEVGKAIFAASLLILTCLELPRAQTLQARIDAAQAGTVVELPAGTYEGGLVVAKPLTIRGGGSAVIDGHGRGTLIKVVSSGVVLDGLVLRDSGDSLVYEDSAVRIEAASATIRGCRLENVLFGVFLVHGPGALIENNTMSGMNIDMGRRGDLVRSWNSDRVTLRGNELVGGRDAVLWFSTGSVVEGNTMRGGRYGLHFMYTNNAVVQNNLFDGNSVGLYVMYSKDLRIEGNRFENHRGPSGAALGLKESDRVAVTGNVFTGNRQAVYIDGSPLLEQNENTFTRNLIAFNDIGVAVLPGVRGDAFFGNAFVDNLQQVSLRGGGQLLGDAWSRDGRGNFWSDYAGYGAAGSAVGRLPHRQESAWESLMDRQPIARFFMFTPAAQAVELAARAFPVFRPKAILSDDAPLLEPPADLPRPTVELASGGLWFPIGLLSGSGLLMGLSRRLGGRAAKTRRPLAAVAGCAVEASGLSKSFGEQKVLSGLDVVIPVGRTVVLWGDNGAGKSTFIKCLLGLHRFEGAVKVFGHDAAAEGEQARAMLGYVAQEFSGYDWTVGEAMSFIARLRGGDEGRIAQTLSRCGLGGQEAKRIPELSGGMKQKLALAQALLCEPPLLVLDEPCASLDPKSRAELLQVLRGLKGSRAILMTSHRVEEAEALADDVLWLEAGRPARLMTRAEFSRAVGEGRPTPFEYEPAEKAGVPS